MLGEFKMIFFFISLLSVIATVFYTGIDYVEAPDYNNRQHAIIFITSLIWGWFSWVAIALFIIVCLIGFPCYCMYIFAEAIKVAITGKGFE